MAKRGAEETKIVACRMSASERAEIDDYLQRAGVGLSDFMRDALLSRARGATTFAELLPTVAASLERQMADLAANVKSQVSGIQALAAASVASSAMLLDDGKSPPEAIAKEIEDHIGRAVAFAPEVVGNLLKRAWQVAEAGADSR